MSGFYLPQQVVMPYYFPPVHRRPIVIVVPNMELASLLTEYNFVMATATKLLEVKDVPGCKDEVVALRKQSDSLRNRLQTQLAALSYCITPETLHHILLCLHRLSEVSMNLYKFVIASKLVSKVVGPSKTKAIITTDKDEVSDWKPLSSTVEVMKDFQNPPTQSVVDPVWSRFKKGGKYFSFFSVPAFSPVVSNSLKKNCGFKNSSEKLEESEQPSDSKSDTVQEDSSKKVNVTRLLADLNKTSFSVKSFIEDEANLQVPLLLKKKVSVVGSINRITNIFASAKCHYMTSRSYRALMSRRERLTRLLERIEDIIDEINLRSNHESMVESLVNSV